MKKYNDIKKLKTELQTKIIRRLTLNSDYEPDENLLLDYIEEAILEIKKWKNNSNDNIFLDGEYNSQIIQFVIESYHRTGIEGQLSNSFNGNVSKYQMTPLQHLKSSIPQGL